jgi:hypothetical protein
MRWRTTIIGAAMKPLVAARDQRPVHPSFPRTLWKNLVACESGHIA